MESTIKKDDPIFGIAYSDTKPMKDDPLQLARRRTSFVEDGAVLGVSGIEEVKKDKKEKNDKKEKKSKKDKKRKRDSDEDDAAGKETIQDEERAEKRQRKERRALDIKEQKKDKAKAMRAKAKEDKKERKAKRAELKLQNKVRHEKSLEAAIKGSEALSADVIPLSGDEALATDTNHQDTSKRKKKREKKEKPDGKKKKGETALEKDEVSIPIRSSAPPPPASAPIVEPPPTQVEQPQAERPAIANAAKPPRVRPIRAQAAAERQLKRDANGASAQSEATQVEQSTSTVPAKPPKRDQFGARLNRVKKPKHRAGRGGRSKEKMTGANDIPLGVRRS